MADQELFPFMHAPQPVRSHQPRKPRAVAKRNDPDTSWEAADSFSPQQLNSLQEKVFNFFKNVISSTDEEMDQAFGNEQFSYSTLRTRRRELVDKGLLEDSGVRVVNKHGKNVIVWQLKKTCAA